jgi:hypothetical protein
MDHGSHERKELRKGFSIIWHLCKVSLVARYAATSDQALETVGECLRDSHSRNHNLRHRRSVSYCSAVSFNQAEPLPIPIPC